MSTSGGAGPEAERLIKKLATRISGKHHDKYPETINFIRIRFCLLRSTLVSLRGTRKNFTAPPPISMCDFVDWTFNFMIFYIYCLFVWWREWIEIIEIAIRQYRVPWWIRGYSRHFGVVPLCRFTLWPIVVCVYYLRPRCRIAVSSKVKVLCF